jgi:hypothetical protein
MHEADPSCVLRDAAGDTDGAKVVANAFEISRMSSDSDSGDESCGSQPTPHRAPGARQYPRRVPAPAAQRKADADAQFLASMRAHFEQVRLLAGW